MRLTKLLLALLTMCLVLTFLACDDGGSSSDPFNSEFDDINKGSGSKFTVKDLTSHEGISNLTTVSGGIKFKEGDVQWEIYITITLNDNKQFASTEKAVMNGIHIGNSQFTGTWSQSGQTITIHATKEKDLDTGKTEPCDKKRRATLSADGKTLTDIDPDPALPGTFIYKKQ